MEGKSSILGLSEWIVSKSSEYAENKANRARRAFTQLGIRGVGQVGLLGFAHSLAHITGISGIREGWSESQGKNLPVRVINTLLRGGTDLIFPLAGSYREERFRTGESHQLMIDGEPQGKFGADIIRADLEYLIPALSAFAVAIVTRNGQLGYSTFLITELAERLIIPYYRAVKAQAFKLKNSKIR